MLFEELSIGNHFGNSIADFALKIVGALLILLVGMWLVRMIVKLVKKGKGFQKLAPEVQTFVASAVKVLGYVLVILMAVTTVGVPKITFMPVSSHRSRNLSKKSKVKTPSSGSVLFQANSAIRTTSIPVSSIRARSSFHMLSGQCSG